MEDYWELSAGKLSAGELTEDQWEVSAWEPTEDHWEPTVVH